MRIIVFLILVAGSLYGQQPVVVTYPDIPAGEGYDILRDEEGNYILTGTGIFENSRDAYLIKVNSSGDTIWQRNYGGLHRDIGWSLENSADNGFYLLGMRGLPDTTFEGRNYMMVAKFDGDGTNEWEVNFRSDSSNSPADILLATNGDVYLTGFGTRLAEGFDKKLVLSRITPAGGLVWNKNFGLFYQPTSMVQAPNGNLVVSGIYDILPQPFPFIMVFNEEGDSLFSKIYTQDLDNAFSNKLLVDPMGGYYLIGGGRSAESRISGLIMKVDEQGELEWKELFQGKSGTAISFIDAYIDEDGKLQLSGHSATTTNYFLWQGSFDPLSRSFCSRHLKGQVNTFGAGIVPAYDGGVAITGAYNSRWAFFHLDDACPEPISDPPSDAVYPNPVEDVLNLDLSYAADGNAGIQMYNTMGQQVFQVDSQPVQGGRLQTSLNLSGLPSGLYYLQVTVGEEQRVFSVWKL